MIKMSWTRELVKMLPLFFVLLGVFVSFALIENLLISTVLAFIVFYILAPFVNRCERRGLSRGLSIFLIYGLNVLVVVGSFVIFIPLIIEQLSLLEQELPTLQSGVLQWVTRLENWLQMRFNVDAPLFRDRLRTWMISQTSEYTSLIPKWISDSLTLLFLTPFLAFFMLRDGALLKRGLINLTPNRYFESVIKLLDDMNHQVGSFIRARLAEAFCVGLMTWLGLLLISFPYAALLALFAAVTNLIPYLGPIIGAVPAFLILLVNSEGYPDGIGLEAGLLLSVYLFAHIVDAIFIIPMVVAKIVNLHPVTVVLVIILGAQALGVLGMIVSIPVASLIKLVFGALYRQTLGSQIASSRPPGR